MYIIFFTLVIFAFNEKRWATPRILEWDVYGYSLYLSGSVIYKDLAYLKFHDTVRNENKITLGVPNTFAFHQMPNGKRLIKYTMGNALTMAPFYFLAHILTYVFSPQYADGYTGLYKFSIVLCSLFWLLLGIYFIKKWLIKYFKVTYINIGILAATLGTNMFYYAAVEVGLAHIPLFFCYSAICYYFNSWLVNNNKNYVYITAALYGLLLLIRPTDGIIIILLALWWLGYNWAKLKNLSYLINQSKQIAIAAIISLLVFMPQIIYWKLTTGCYFYDSYIGEHFDFTQPHIFKGLFSWRRGLFLYTPMAIFMFMGVMFLPKILKPLAVALCVFFIVGVYITFSWQQWWYGGHFGMRAFIQWYPFLILGVAALLQKISSIKNAILKQIFMLLCTIFISCFLMLNIFQCLQYAHGIIRWDDMTRETYLNIFFKYELPWPEMKRIYGDKAW